MNVFREDSKPPPNVEATLSRFWFNVVIGMW